MRDPRFQDMFAIDWKETTQGITVFDRKGIEYLTQTENWYFEPRILDLTEFIVLRSTTLGYKDEGTENQISWLRLNSLNSTYYKK